MLARMPDEAFSMKRAHPATFAKIDDGTMNCMGVFCKQEMVRFNKLVTVVQATLNEMRRALKGLVVRFQHTHRPPAPPLLLSFSGCWISRYFFFELINAPRHLVRSIFV